MKIGMTYDLRADYLAEGYGEEETAEFDRPDTIDAIEGALKELGFETDRIGHIRQLTARLVQGDRWDMVFNIAEGLKGFGRESQVPALLEAYNIPYTFSDPLVLSLTLHKAMTKRVVRDLGLPTPDFFVVNKPLNGKVPQMAFPLFAKPMAEGTGKGITARSIIANTKELKAVSRHLLKQFHQPVLVERFLPGREFTVAVLGTNEQAFTLPAMEVVLNEKAEPGVYSYINKEKCESLVEYRLAHDEPAKKAEKTALDVYKGLGCRDAGRIDMRLDDNGVPNFIEINPLAGLHPEHSDLCIIAGKAGMPYTTLIRTIMISACKRYNITDVIAEEKAHGKYRYRRCA